ncbi:MAG: efflux RND transporter periplasmic adaptor subunit [Thermodesulfobacteriota bacterium]
MKPKRPPLPVVIGLLAAVALLILYLTLGPETGAPAIITSGHVEVTEVDMSFRLSGHVARLAVEEGDRVKAGQVLAELKRVTLTARRDQVAAQLAELEARRDSQALALAIREEVLAAGVSQAEAGVSAAAARYESLKTGSRAEEIQTAALARDRARTEMENLERDYRRMSDLYGRKVVPASQLEDARTAFESAKAAYEAAEEQYKLVKAGPRREAVEEGQAQVSGSDAALRAAKAQQREVEKLKLDLQALEAQISQARAALAVAEDDLVEASLPAPFSAVVTVKEVEEGEFVQAGAPVMTLAQLDRVWVRTYIPEVQLGRVKLGQRAKVTTDTFPDKVYEGRVVFISPEAEFTPKNVQTKEERVKLVYRLKVSLANPNQELKAGMPVDVVFE